MCEQSNLLSTVTSVVEDVNQIYKEKTEDVLQDVAMFKQLLKNLSNNSKVSLQSPGSSKHYPSPKRPSFNSPKPRPKPLSLRNSIAAVRQPGNSFLGSMYNDENVSPLGSPVSKVDYLFQKGFTKELKECVENVDEYLEERQKPNKQTEVEKQRFLLQIENSWENELKTLNIFEPDLAETAFKYLSFMNNKDQEPELPEWPINKMMRPEEEMEKSEKFLDESQLKIHAALLEDLGNIQFEKLREEKNKSLAIGMFTTVASLSDIRSLKSSVAFKREPWQNIDS